MDGLHSHAALTTLAALVADEGGLVAAALRPVPVGDAPYADAIAGSPRAPGHPADLPLVIEAVREGYLLHHGGVGGLGNGRILDGDDADLALLAGDRLYALGLARLAAAEDLGAVAALADLISLAAQAAAAADTALGTAVWAAGCAELGWGSTPALEAAKNLARAGDSGAADALGAAARQIAADVALPR